jgi:hypothetical protein
MEAGLRLGFDGAFCVDVAGNIYHTVGSKYQVVTGHNQDSLDRQVQAGSAGLLVTQAIIIRIR